MERQRPSQLGIEYERTKLLSDFRADQRQELQTGTRQRRRNAGAGLQSVFTDMGCSYLAVTAGCWWRVRSANLPAIARTQFKLNFPVSMVSRSIVPTSTTVS